jgi:hypothetical protein
VDAKPDEFDRTVRRHRLTYADDELGALTVVVAAATAAVARAHDVVDLTLDDGADEHDGQTSAPMDGVAGGVHLDLDDSFLAVTMAHSAVVATVRDDAGSTTEPITQSVVTGVTQTGFE